MLPCESNQYCTFWVCTYSRGSPVCKEHGPHFYCHLSPVWLYRIFAHYLIKKHAFPGEKAKKYKILILTFSTTFVWNIFLSKKHSTIYFHKCTYVFIQSACNSYSILMQLIFSRTFFETYLNIKYYENLSIGSRVAPYGRTDMTKLTF